ncbi:MAG TPA: glycosyltransferase [Baekduia sp.]|nr:glycosyltransferase [Baekduia sp.]
MSDRSRTPSIGVALVDVAAPLEHFDFTTADRWHVIVLDGGVPVARAELASPGATSGPALARAAILRHADRPVERRRLVADLERRLGVRPTVTGPPQQVTVVVCTHGRPDHLPRALGAIAALDPAPLEVVIIDNAPGERDCRELVESYGFRYVREDRKGLDNARNAGLRAARGTVVAFTDDDCVPGPRWLGGVDELFADPTVAVVTGPALAYTMADPAQARMERQASLSRGFERRRWEWTILSAVHGGQVGVGANMLLRTAHVAELGAEPFPPELDAGTPTESGGDTYVFGRLLARGRRLIYDPATFVFHVHREDTDALERAVRGYGSGMAAALTKNLLRQRELEVPRAAFWFVRQLSQTFRRYLLGRADEEELRVSWLYVRGALDGPGRWAVTRWAQRGETAAPWPRAAVAPGDSAAGAVPRTGGPVALRLSVVVPTVGRLEALGRCLDALAAQDAPAGSFDVVVVDDAAQPTSIDSTARPELPVRVLRTGGVGAARARNAGAAAAEAPLVLFVDDDVVAEPGLVAAHLDAHDGGAAEVVLGVYPPRPRPRTLAASGAELWWADHFDEMTRTGHLTFTSVLSGNTSVRRASFLARGGFPEEISVWRREDWAWGLQLLDEGVPIAVAPAARAWHEYRLSASGRLDAAYREGRGDALLCARWPQALSGLDARHTRFADPRRQPLRWLALRLLPSPAGRRATSIVLAALEWLHLRDPWSRLHRLAQRAAYAAGVRDGGFVPQSGTLADVVGAVDIVLDDDGPVDRPAGAVAQVARVRVGELTQDVAPPEGHWGPALAAAIADELDWSLWRRALPQRPAPAPAADPATVALVVTTQAAAAAGRALGLTTVVARPGDVWGAAAQLLAEDGAPFVGILLGALAPTRGWLDATMLAFDGSRVAAVVGEVLDEEDPDPPVGLYDLDPRRLPYLRLPVRYAFAILRGAPAVAAGSLQPGHARLGEAAPLLTLVERLLEDGWVVAERSSPELGATAPTGPRPGLDVGRARITGLRLAAGRARATGGRDGRRLALRTLVTAGNAVRVSAKRRASARR